MRSLVLVTYDKYLKYYYVFEEFLTLSTKLDQLPNYLVKVLVGGGDRIAGLLNCIIHALYKKF